MARTIRSIAWLAVSAVVLAFLSSAQAGKPNPGSTKPAPAASASASAPAPGPVPLAQSLTGQAKADYEAARLLYNDGDYVRYYAQVLALVRRYEAEGGSLLTEQDVQEARALASTVEAFTAQLKITVNEPGASISVDGKQLGRGSWTGKLPSGGHTLSVRAPGMLPYQSEVVIQDGETRTVEVALTKLPVAHAPAAPQRPQPPPAQFEATLRLDVDTVTEETLDDGLASGLPNVIVADAQWLLTTNVSGKRLIVSGPAYILSLQKDSI